MKWLLTTGLGVDIAGAFLIVVAALRLDPLEVAQAAVRLPGGNRAQVTRALRESAYAQSGIILLTAGFLLQLTGYAVDFGWWPLLVALASGGSLGFGGYFVARRRERKARDEALAELDRLYNQ